MSAPSNLVMTYYIQTNLIAFLAAVILIIHSKRVTSKNSTSSMIMGGLFRLLIVLCLSDIFAYVLRGKSLIGVQISNIIYYSVMAIGSYFWFVFIVVKTNQVENLKKLFLMTCIPAVLLIIGILTNPIHGLFFSFDKNIMYHRENGIYLVWLIEWGYFTFAFVVNAIAVKKEKRSYLRNEFKGYLIFFIPMLVAAFLQMIYYGTTLVQIGFMFSLLIAYLNRQFYMVQTDALTGLNNRNAFLHTKDVLFDKAKTSDLTVFMIDVDKFKYINDYFGHLKGDKALTDIADVLKAVVKENSFYDLYLFRYAGDEFVIIANDLNEYGSNVIVKSIENNLKIKNEENREIGEKYVLSLSIAFENGLCSSIKDFDILYQKADEKMYEVKNSKKLLVKA